MAPCVLIIVGQWPLSIPQQLAPKDINQNQFVDFCGDFVREASDHVFLLMLCVQWLHVSQFFFTATVQKLVKNGSFQKWWIPQRPKTIGFDIKLVQFWWFGGTMGYHLPLGIQVMLTRKIRGGTNQLLWDRSTKKLPVCISFILLRTTVGMPCVSGR